jgi:hypothetical protein
VRERPEKIFKYWIQLGKTQWWTSEHYSLSILVVLPKEARNEVGSCFPDADGTRYSGVHHEVVQQCFTVLVSKS